MAVKNNIQLVYCADPSGDFFEIIYGRPLNLDDICEQVREVQSCPLLTVCNLISDGIQYGYKLLLTDPHLHVDAFDNYAHVYMPSGFTVTGATTLLSCDHFNIASSNDGRSALILLIENRFSLDAKGRDG